MTDFFARQPSVEPYVRRAQEVAMERNPGVAASVSFELDGPDSAHIPEQEWISVKGRLAYERHVAYLRTIGASSQVAAAGDERPAR
jgi:hypothetical protein